MSQTTNWPLRILLILVVTLIGSIFAVFVWYLFAYLGMTIIIALDSLAHALAWMKLGPAGGWFLIGFLVGGFIVCVKTLRRFAKKEEAKRVIILTPIFALLFFAVSLGLTADMEKRTQAVELEERRQREVMELKRAREAEENARLDQLHREGKLWQMVRIDNRMSNKVSFQVQNNKGEWKDYTLRPGAGLTYWEKVRRIQVRFDASFSAGNQEKLYTVVSTPIVDHEPTKAEQATAKVNFFKLNGGGIDLYHN
jgi:hypothetical protein